MAPGDFRRNLLKAMELDEFLGLGGLGRVGAGNGPETGSVSSGSGFWPLPEHRADSGSGVAAGAVRTAVIAGSVDTGSAAWREEESKCPVSEWHQKSVVLGVRLV